jgi:hypothetical protein
MSLHAGALALQLDAFKQSLQGSLYPLLTQQLSASLHLTQLPAEAYAALGDVLRDACRRADADTLRAQPLHAPAGPKKPTRHKANTFKLVRLFSCFFSDIVNQVVLTFFLFGLLQEPKLKLEEFVNKNLLRLTTDAETGLCTLHLVKFFK